MSKGGEVYARRKVLNADDSDGGVAYAMGGWLNSSDDGGGAAVESEPLFFDWSRKHLGPGEARAQAELVLKSNTGAPGGDDGLYLVRSCADGSYGISLIAAGVIHHYKVIVRSRGYVCAFPYLIR